MSKKKNTSNQTTKRKNHRNGIKQPNKNILSKAGMELKLILNESYSKKYNGIGRMAFEEKFGVQK